jgi:hypothetical protein
LPSSNLFGRLKEPANEVALKRWVKQYLVENDPAIVALDTVVYGGLIPSRVGNEPLETLLSRMDAFFDTLRSRTVYGFSSILRIPNYNLAEEEPDYWANYGKALYDFSVKAHQTGHLDPHGTSQLPLEVLSDFLHRRKRNFAINELYIDRLKLGRLDYLVYCQDDTGPYGLNVEEAEKLGHLLERRQCQSLAHVQTGADEVATCLAARLMVGKAERPPRIYPIYSHPAGGQIQALFDGIPLEVVVAQRIYATGAELAESADDADIWLFVHTPAKRQGDHCERTQAWVQPDQIEQAMALLSDALSAGKPLAIADVAYANGADPQLAQRLVFGFSDLRGLYGYAAWNTPGNAIGTATSMAVVRWTAEREERFRPLDFHRLLFIRFADDWLYQADIRHRIRAERNQSIHATHPEDEHYLNALMSDSLAMLKQRFGLDSQPVSCRFPCQRTFEVEIVLGNPLA